jgi:RNA polymerase sigma factor (sigma-70 family)
MPDISHAILCNHEKFLSFLRSRVENRETAEDILQSAYLKGMERARTLKDAGKVVPWFYRLLRNQVVDHYRRRAVKTGKLAEFAETQDSRRPHEERDLERVAWRCIGRVIDGLKPEYARLLKKVELEGATVKEAAQQLGIAPASATVRLHRARKSLKKALLHSCGACTEHDCLDCTCRGV